MQTVRDGDGREYLLLKRSAEASLVREPGSGEESYVPNDELEPVDCDPLATAAGVVPEELSRLLTAVRDERALGLLLEIDARGPVGVRTLLSSYGLCESDLHGLVGEFRAAGLVTEQRVGGERGYDTTASAGDALDQLRGRAGQ
jgi:hypothetical protein